MSTGCEDARRAIEEIRFVGWRGLPAGCAPEALVGLALDERWGRRTLGSEELPARMHLLELAGYYRPLVSVREGSVVLFDGRNPALVDGWPALEADLGAPERTQDFVHGTVPMRAGERIHATRGITIYLNPENQMVVHLAVYVPTTADDYLSRLRPELEKQRHGAR